MTPVSRPPFVRRTLLGALRRKLRLRRYIAEAKADRSPFVGDRILRQAVDFMLAECQVTHFVETGTYLGHTCRYIASTYTGLPITTIEQNEEFYAAAQVTLGRCPTVTRHLGDSADVLRRILAANAIRGLPFFFLDAHWYDYLPLPSEIHTIGEYMSDAIMLIHDFQVPGRSAFGYDTCNGATIGLAMLRDNLVLSKPYRVFLPLYSYQDAYPNIVPQPMPLRGHALVFQGASLAVSKFCRSASAVYYDEVSL